MRTPASQLLQFCPSVSGDYYLSLEISFDDGPTDSRGSDPWDDVTNRIAPPSLTLVEASESSQQTWVDSETNVWNPRLARGSSPPAFSDTSVPAIPIPMRRLPSQDLPRQHARRPSIPFLDLEPDREPADPRIGTAIGPYRIIRPIGAGGMGVVYLARHDRLNRQVAIKFLHASQTSEEHVKRFLGEAIAANAIAEPGVVSILDYGTTSNGSAYLIMEYLRGMNLDSRLDDDFNPMTTAELVDITRHIAQTLSSAHHAGIIHRDLKPSNVFLVDRGPGERPDVKVLDFGAAKFFGALPATAHTAQGRIIGTPGYMAPEQISIAPSIDPRADVYALGCLLYRMLCGRTPFTGTTEEILKAHHTRPPITPTQYNPNIPRQLERLVLQMLAKDPAKRPQTMTSVAIELEIIHGWLD